MMDIGKLASAGGIFFILVFIHFVVDWIFQTSYEAMNKHNNWIIRARHCFTYMIGFLPIMYLLGFEVWEIFAACAILFVSHFYLDTYHGVFIWAKYIRKPDEMKQRPDCVLDSKKGFFEFASTPLGKILVIVVDQIIHMVFLIPLVWMALN